MKFRNRPRMDVTIRIPVSAFESLQEIAEEQETTVEALLRAFVSDGLRAAMAKRGADKVLESAFNVLYKHLRSEAEVNALVDEIRLASAEAQ